MALGYRNIILPTSISSLYEGGRGFDTSIEPLVSGHESRQVNRDQALGEWDIAYPIDTTVYKTIRTFHYNVRGMGYSFGFRDWSDYYFEDGAQSIGTGDAIETDFQIYKRYTVGAFSYDRNITKPDTSTLRVWINSVEQLSGWTVDELTGIITFSAPPPDTLDVAASCQFYTPVRFGTDRLNILMTTDLLASIPSIPIREVLID